MLRPTDVRFVCLAAGLLVLGIAACGSSDEAVGDPAADAGGPSVVTDGGRDTGTGTVKDAATSDADGAAPTGVTDPAKDGPLTFTESDVVVNAATGDKLTLHVVLPTGGTAPYPLVFIGAGFMIPTAEYVGYAKRLATHGIVGVTVDMPQDGGKFLKDAANLDAALDWAAAPGADFAGKLDPARAGVMGHSRGGKAAVLAAVGNAKWKALLGLDPVDSNPPFPKCDPVTECPDGSDAIKTLTVPSGFLGETLDGTGILTPCAPTADDYATFYANAPTPSFSVTINGASHISFVDDPSQCGPFICTVCKTPTLPQATVLDLARAYTAAFFLRHLTGNAGYDTYLTGADAKSRYVTPGTATLDTK